jgi:hypothetical protein
VAGSCNGEADCGNCRIGHGISFNDEVRPFGCNLSQRHSVFDNRTSLRALVKGNPAC